jgi:opacity protein-like surface antigen
MRTTLCALAAFAVLALVAVSAASASPPVITRVPSLGTASAVVSGFCATDITLTFTVTDWSRTDFFDSAGNLTESHYKFFEQDTFTGPTGTLIGDKYSLEFMWTYDSSGNVTHIYGDGVQEKVTLPNGRAVLISVGRVDYLSGNPLEPEFGHTSGFAPLCAAIGA